MSGELPVRKLARWSIEDIHRWAEKKGFKTITDGKTVIIFCGEVLYIFRRTKGMVGYRKVRLPIAFGEHLTDGGTERNMIFYSYLWTENSFIAKALIRVLVTEELVRAWTHDHSCAGDWTFFPPPIAVRKSTMTGEIETDGKDVKCPAIDEMACSIGNTILQDWWKAFDISSANYVRHWTGRGHQIFFHRLSPEVSHILGLPREDWWELVRVFRRRMPILSPPLSTPPSEDG